MPVIESRGFGLIHFIDMDRLIFNVVAFKPAWAESVPFDRISKCKGSTLQDLIAHGTA
jgi:hypothetical protein